MNDDRTRPRHPIQVAARRAGLNPALLRAWERRYRAITPLRATNQQRLYSDADVERLRRLRMVTDAGRRIGEVATLDDEALAAVLAEDAGAHRSIVPPGISGRPSVDELLEAGLAHVRDRDERGLRRVLERAVLLYEPLLFLDDVLGLLLERVGEAWNDHAIEPGQEHVTRLVVRTLLEDLLTRLAPDQPRARVAVGAMDDDRDAIGGFGLAVALAVCGCETVRLATGMRVDEIASTAREQSVDAIALAVTPDRGSRRTEENVLTLRGVLDPDVQLIVGGRAGYRLRDVFEHVGAAMPGRMQDLPDVIDTILDRTSAASHRHDPRMHDHSIAS